MRRATLLLTVIFLALQVPSAYGDEDLLKEAKQVAGVGEYSKAVKLYRKLVDDEAKPGQATIDLIRLRRLTGKHDEAAKLIEGAVPKAAGSVLAELHVEAAELAMDTGKTDAAAKALEAALAAKPGMLEARTVQGLLALTLGKTKEAMDGFMKLFDDYDPNANTYTSRELTYQARAFYELCMRSGKVNRTDTLQTVINDLVPEALELDQYNHGARWLRGEVLVSAYHSIEAKKTFEAGLKINTHHPLLRVGLGLALAQRYGTLRQAPDQVHHALKTNGKLVIAHETLASLYLADELYEKAKKHLDKALAVNPRSLSTLSVLAGYHYLRGEKDLYKKVEKQVLALQPKYGAFYYTVASIIEAQRQFETGAALCRKALKLNPKLWHAWVKLGGNLLRIGQEEEAKKALKVVEKEFFFHVQSRNYLLLLRSYNEYVVRNTENFRIRLHVSENDVLRGLVSKFMERAHKSLSRKYGHTIDGPILFEMFHKHDDFAVRTIGLSGLGALGACFGKVVTMDSPRAFGRPFNWAATAWHEFAHVVTLQQSGMRVPRWFTEGLSEYEEYCYNKSWVRPMHSMLHAAWTRGSLRGIGTLNAGFTRPKYPQEVVVCYFQGGLLCRFIADKFGFDSIPKMLKLYASGHKTPDVIKKGLGLTIKEFDKQSLAYLKKNIFDKINVLPTFSGDQMEDLKDDLEDEPDNLETREKLAAAYFSRGMEADAELKAGQVIRKNPKATTAHLVLGRLQYRKKNYARAKTHFEAAIKNGAKDFHARLLLGHIYKNQDKNMEMAVESWVKAKSLFPFYVGPGSPYGLLAKYHKDKGDLGKWAAEIEGIVSRENKNVKARQELVAYYVEEANHEKVIKYTTEIVEVSPYHPDALLFLGKSLVATKKAKDALLPLKICIELKPKNMLHRVYTTLAEAYLELDEKVKARVMVTEALTIKPDYARAKRLKEKLGE